MQEIEISRNELQEKCGEYLPFVKAIAGVEQEKTARYTRMVPLEEHLTIKDEEPFPGFFGNYIPDFRAS